MYYNGDSSYPGYNIYEFSFGNLAQTVRIIPPTKSIYFNTTLSSPLNNLIASTKLLQFDYVDGLPNTTFYRYSENNNVLNHVQVDSFTITGVWELKTVSANGQCILFKNSANEFRVDQFMSNGTSASVTATNSIPTLLASQSASVNWKISDDCLRIKSDSNVYSASSTTTSFSLVGAVSGWMADDDSLTYVLTSNTVLKYTSSNSSYDVIHTLVNLTFTSQAIISSYNNRIVIAEVGASTASAFAFIDNSGVLTELLNHQSTGYDSTPTIKISPQCTKVFVYGLVSAAAQTNFFYVNYANLQNIVITFPAASIFDPASIYFNLQ